MRMTHHIINQNGESITDDWGHLPLLSVDDLSSLNNDASKAFIITSDDDLDAILPHFKGVAHIAIDFTHFADGRGFSWARILRDEGFTGHLRAIGHIMPDQFRHAMAVGFDDIALPSDLSERYGAEAWRDVAAFKLPDYQSRLQAKV